MRNDDFQVLGVERKKRQRNRWLVVMLAVIAIAIAVGLGAYWATSPQTVRTGKKMGDPTIVPELQAAADSLLNAKLTEIDGLQGQAIVMDVKTGEILAMVGRERKFDGTFQPCENFAYQQELGSVAKAASLLAVLETGKMKLSDEVETAGGVWPVGEDMLMRDHNWRRGGYGVISLERVLAVSSNVGMGQAVDKSFHNNQQQFFDLLDKMSFGQPDSIEGIIGQMLTFYNAIANNGKMVKPTLKTGMVEIINPQIASKANIDSMQVALEHVVSRGLGKKAGSPFVGVAGKTGTSQVGVYDFGQDSSVEEYLLSFCGYFPADAPRYSIIVSLNKLGLPASGGGMAGVLFHNIVEWMIQHRSLLNEESDK